jgi:glycosyltransferase involved in cell wall biosynthesis
MFASVIMAAYNAERYVAEAVESVLQQTHPDFELIVADDGSTDATQDILRRIMKRDQRVRVLFCEHRGAAAARNSAVAEARSEWIVVMDSDDVMEPNRLERQIDFVSEHPGLDIASCLVTWINEHGHVLGKSQSELTTESAVAETFRRDAILVFSHPGCMIRRDMIQRVGGYRPEFWPSEDLDLFSRIAGAGGRILVQPEYLMKYRIHPQSGTGIGSDLDTSQFNWIRQCTLNRRSGLPEPTYQEFVQSIRSLPPHRRLDQRRRDIADIWYRKATLAYSLGQVERAVVLILGSSMLDPANSPKQVWRKFLKGRFERLRGGRSAP